MDGSTRIHCMQGGGGDLRLYKRWEAAQKQNWVSRSEKSGSGKWWSYKSIKRVGYTCTTLKQYGLKGMRHTGKCQRACGPEVILKNIRIFL